MATTITQSRNKDVKDYLYAWIAQDKSGKAVRGEMRASGDSVVVAQLRRQGLSNIKVKRQRVGAGRKITEKDITIFSRQLAVMMKAGVPLLQAFDIVGKGHSNPSVQKVLLAREFSALPKVLIAASPTRGLDVGAIEAVRERLVAAANEGVGVLLISEDLDEIMSLADRIVVMYEGRLVDEVAAESADRERLGLTMGGSTVSGGAR